MNTRPTVEPTARRLATIETITSIDPIPNADAIDRARVRGWDVVVKKGEYASGDRCVYFELDSFLDTTDPRFKFLAPRGVRTAPDGSSGHVLKTAKLRGVYSQGLALPIGEFPEICDNIEPGTDVTQILGITKWDPPLPAELAGQVRGRLPGWIPATDEERIQNIPTIIAADAEWVATEKIDGTSTTFYVNPGTEHVGGVCSRNLDLLPSESNHAVEDGPGTVCSCTPHRAVPWVSCGTSGRNVRPWDPGKPAKTKRPTFLCIHTPC